MKIRQKKKDLFTVDTIGEHNEFDGDKEYEILYPNDETENTEDSENSDAEEEEIEEENETETDIEPIEEDEEQYDYGGKKKTTLFIKLQMNNSNCNLPFNLNVGLPPPSVDIISILKNPVLARRPLYGDVEEITKPTSSEIDLDAFCKAMGWTEENGYLPRKPADEQVKRRSKYKEIDLTDVHKDLTKTNVEKEMSTCILKGIETKKEVKIPSEREAHRQRKVNFRLHD